MSTPPTPPPPSATKGRSNLATLAIIFAVTSAVTFGLCSITLISSHSTISGPIFPAAIIIEAICIVGLIGVGITAIVRKAQTK